MVTTDEKARKSIGAVKQAGQAAERLYEEIVTTAYGGRRGSAYPLALIIITIVILGVWYHPAPYAALLPLVLLALWVGGHR